MKIIYILFAISGLIFLTALGTVYVQLGDRTSLLFLHYTNGNGFDFLGSKGDVFALLGTGMGMGLLNLFLARLFNRREHFLSLILALFTVFFSLLLFLTILAIISFN